MQTITPLGVPAQVLRQHLLRASENAPFLVCRQLKNRVGTTQRPAGMGLGSQQVRGGRLICEQGPCFQLEHPRNNLPNSKKVRNPLL